jgi:hypothetical protein
VVGVEPVRLPGPPQVEAGRARNMFRYASRKYWDQIAHDLRPIYTAANEAEAKAWFAEFAEKWGKPYPAIKRLWENAWAGSPDVLPRRGPLRTGRASCPRIRLKQARWDRGLDGPVRRAALRAHWVWTRREA